MSDREMKIRNFLIVGIFVICMVRGFSWGASQDAEFLGLFIGFAISSIFTMILNAPIVKYNKEKEKKESAAKLFTEQCRQYGIIQPSDINTKEKEQRVQLIAREYSKIWKPLETEYLSILENNARELDIETAKAKTIKLDELRKKEDETYRCSVQYASFHGIEKPLAMIDSEIAKYSMEERTPGYIPLKKESDGAVLAGVAAGIGGTVPALMSLSNTERKNVAIRESNSAITQLNMSIMDMHYKRERDRKNNLKKLQNIRKTFIGRLTAELPQEEIFKKLSIQTESKQVSETGTVTVKAKVKLKETFPVFERSEATTDGSITAQIYAGNNEKVGEAVMVFPYNGIGEEAIELTGICLNCANPGKLYRVKYVPRDLWLMEKM